MRNGSFALAPALAAALVACTEAQPCPSPLEVCDGVCVDTNQDVDYCGSCQTSCVPGQVCLDGGCLESTLAPCDIRTGGGYVLLETCGQSVKAWIAAADFIDAAEDPVVRAAAPYPVLDVRDGTDCDGQWTWHVDPDTARFMPTAQAGCAACPDEIEASKATWIGEARPWCPDPVEFLLVERR